ncbi:hypothetical protein HAZT_HAZT003900 [Hyalella azteca]|uniref:Beta-1,4-glucuronyltransferase 1 n=1 Tax=Hyalella azteca TaxID=294128 RepID=A0A6A0HDR7_HYAAZ|nr:hypothetical protein HAZT_HAZT003900 [Hyalella azteca]
MNLRYCLKLAVVLLLLNVSAIIFMNIIFMLTTPSAVKEKYVTVGPPKSLLEDEYIAEGDYKETEDQTREKKLIKQFEIDLSTGLWDKSRVFKVHPFIIKSSKSKGLAQQFHIRVFKNNQANSNLSYWETVPSTDGSLNIAYNITTWKRHWEPIYVTNAKVPAFEERFIGYGFTRNSQVYEMRLAGYSWLMLDGAFLTHRGFQTKRTHTKTRRKQIAENSGRFNIFVRELYQRYHIQLKDEDAMSAFGQKTHTKTEDKKIENHQIENVNSAPDSPNQS